MSLFWVVLGTAAQLVLGFFLFMLAVFGGGGIANGHTLSKLHSAILDISIFALPASCALAAGVVLYLYKTGGSASSYGWYAAPLIPATLYVMFALKSYPQP